MEALLALLGTGFAVLFIVVLGCSVLLNVVGLPANWLILVLAVLWYFGVPQENSMGLWYWIGMCALAVAGEVMETGVQLLKAKRHGSSSAGTLAGMIGGIIGAIVLAPLFFGLGALIGASFLQAGCGYGGSCFPKDVKALIHTAETSGVEPMLLNAVEAVNARQKRHMAERIQEYFAPQGGVKGKTLAIWGLAFKANTDDMREAAAISIISALTAEGMKIRAFDPIAADNARHIFKDNPLVEIVDDQYAVCDGSQALLVVTEWNQFRNPDFERIKGLLTAPILFDGRNLYSPAVMAERGFAYFCIGRKSSM